MQNFSVSELLVLLNRGPRSTEAMADALHADPAELFEFLFRSGRSLGITAWPEGDEIIWADDLTAGIRNLPPLDPALAKEWLSRIGARSRVRRDDRAAT